MQQRHTKSLGCRVRRPAQPLKMTLLVRQAVAVPKVTRFDHDVVLACNGQDIIAHMASSTAGFRKGQEYHLNQVRIGSALYGSGPSDSAFRWLTRITGIKEVLLLLHRDLLTLPVLYF